MKSVSAETSETIQDVVVQGLPRWIEENSALRRRLAHALSQAFPPAEEAIRTASSISYREFLEWADEDTLAEWVGGQVVMYGPASKRHQDLANLLVSVMRIFVEQHDIGVVLSAPFQMKLERSGREPDLLFVAKEHFDRLEASYLDGPADLAIEILSPESAGRDRGDKFYEYAEGGVTEYWLIDPQQTWVEFYRLEEGRYRLAFAGNEGTYRALTLPGFWLQVEWLWQDPLPKTMDVLRTLDLL